MAQLMLVNPRKRRRTRRKTKRRSTAVARRRSYAPVRRRTRRVRRRRNPIATRGIMKNVVNSFQDGAVGSLGAIAGSIVSGVLPIPDTLKEGNLAPIVQGLIGIGTGMVVGKFMNRKVGEQMATGAVTIALHGSMKNIISRFAPNLPLGEYDDGLLGAYGYGDGLLGAYDDDMSDLGYTNAAAVSDYGDDSDVSPAMGAYSTDWEM